jgi:anion-transporting  ArsA/GET3 family ATPase
VGKTTTAATLAINAARAGKKTLVVTIDPARRLAAALGLPELDHQVRRVPDDRLAALGALVPGGSLWAMMLDQKRAFDELVEHYARNPESKARVFKSKIYTQMSSSLAGAHEYAAMGKLYQLAGESDYQCIVVDTPPTTHALDFLDAPERLASLVDSPAVDWLVKPLKSSGRFSLNLLSRGTGFVLKRIAKFVGSGFLEDMAHFFIDFNEVMGGFRERAREVHELLRGPAVTFVVVTAPEGEAVDEALMFADRLITSAMPLAGFVVNRVLPPPPGPQLGVAAIEAALARRGELDELPASERTAAAQAFAAADAADRATAHAQQQQIQRLRAIIQPGHVLVQVPLMEHDIHDLAGLFELATHLV